VSRAKNRVGIEKSATAQMAESTELNADNRRKIALNGGNATNDVRGVLLPVEGGVILRNSCSRDEGRHREGDEDGFGEHVGDMNSERLESLLEIERSDCLRSECRQRSHSYTPWTRGDCGV
jgi:hypothetical protein